MVCRCFNQCQVGLATGLAQGPVRDSGTGTHGSFPTGSSLPSPDRAPGLGHLPTLPQRRRDGRASGVPVSGPRSRQEGYLARRHLHYRPATPLELPGTDWGGDPPPRPGMRERESRFDVDCLMCLSCRLLVGHEHEHLRGAGPLRSAVLPGRTDPAARQHAVLLPARTPPGRRRLGPSLRRRRTGDRRQRRVLGTARHPAALERPGRRQNDDHHRPD